MNKYIHNISEFSRKDFDENSMCYSTRRSKISYTIEKTDDTSEEHVVNHLQRVATDLLIIARKIESNGFVN